LEAKLRDRRKSADEETLFHAGLFLFFLGKADKAKEYLDRVLKVTGSIVRKDALQFRGWIEIELNTSFSSDQANTVSAYFGDDNRT
jgi:tetratricopeptide repeat protein 21B